MRRLLLDDEEDQSHPDKIFAALRHLLEVRLRLGRLDSHVDATHLQRIYRRPYFELADRYAARVEAFFFDAPLETCIERNRLRNRRVPEAVMREMAARLEPPTLDEGFARVVRPGKKQLSRERC